MIFKSPPQLGQCSTEQRESLTTEHTEFTEGRERECDFFKIVFLSVFSSVFSVTSVVCFQKVCTSSS